MIELIGGLILFALWIISQFILEDEVRREVRSSGVIFALLYAFPITFGVVTAILTYFYKRGELHDRLFGTFLAMLTAAAFFVVEVGLYATYPISHYITHTIMFVLIATMLVLGMIKFPKRLEGEKIRNRIRIKGKRIDIGDIRDGVYVIYYNDEEDSDS